MALKSTVFVEVELNDHKYTFYMPYGRPLQECYDAVQKISQELVEFSNSLAKSMEENKAENPPVQEKGENDGDKQS